MLPKFLADHLARNQRDERRDQKWLGRVLTVGVSDEEVAEIQSEVQKTLDQGLLDMRKLGC